MYETEQKPWGFVLDLDGIHKRCPRCESKVSLKMHNAFQEEVCPYCGLNSLKARVGYRYVPVIVVHFRKEGSKGQVMKYTLPNSEETIYAEGASIDFEPLKGFDYFPTELVFEDDTPTLIGYISFVSEDNIQFTPRAKEYQPK